MIDKEERREKRIRHYNNYRELLESSKVKNNHEMSKLTGIYPTMFTDWSKGRCEPNAEKLLAICKVLKVNPKKIIN